MTDDLTGRCPHGLFIDVFCAVCDEIISGSRELPSWSP